MSAVHDQISITMPVAHWLLVDAVLDDEISVEGENADPSHRADSALPIREIGWEHLPDWPTDPAGFSDWPRPGQTVTMQLTRAQWTLIVDCLHQWATVSMNLNTAEDHAQADQRRQIARQIQQHVTEDDAHSGRA
jgi:hypothetical protein